MKVLLLTPAGVGKHLACLDLAKRLTVQGHHVVWACQKIGVDRIRRSGFETVAAGPEQLDFDRPASWAPELESAVGWDSFLFTVTELLLRPLPLIVDDLLAAYPHADFDVVIGDICSPAARILAELWHCPWVCLSTLSLGYSDESIPPYAFEDEADAGWSRNEYHGGHDLICRRFNELRARYSLAPVTHGWNDFYSPELTVAVTTPLFEYPRRILPKGLVFTGPLVESSPQPLQSADLANWVAQYEEQGILYGTLGVQVGAVPGLLETVLRGVLKTGVPALISTGTQVTLAPEFQHLPRHIRVVSWVNHRAILPYMRAAIIHGAMTTLADTISFGLPTLTLPVGFDARSSSRKLAIVGAGLRVPVSLATPEVIAANIPALMNTRGLRERAEVLQATFRRSGGASLAVSLIEDLVRCRGGRSGGPRRGRQVSAY